MQSVLHSFGYALDFIREQVADLSPAEMVAQPAGVANHPAWVIGHLTFTCQMLGGAIGMAEWLPNHLGERFGPGSTPVADLGRYEPKDRALAQLTDAQSRLTEAVERLKEHELDAPFPDESYRDVFPSIRHALTQVLVGHPAYHVGQLNVWRKAMGLPPVGRSFE